VVLVEERRPFDRRWILGELEADERAGPFDHDLGQVE